MGEWWRRRRRDGVKTQRRLQVRDSRRGTQPQPARDAVVVEEVAARQALQAAFDLTDRETQVLFWLSRGKTNQEIAQILEMSPRTVNKHLEPVFRKLGVENRTAAVATALAISGQQ